jgi:uncharacterized protein
MFGFSLQKFLVLVAVIALVWYGFKFIGRLQDQRKAEGGLGARAARRPKARGAASATEPKAQDAEDMVACPVCQAYVQARGATRCERSDCPY